MDSWKAEVRRVRREKIRRKKMQTREKVGKSRNTVFFQWFAAPEGRKVGSLKRRVRSQLARWEMKSCTPLWREAHFQVKTDKTLEERTTLGSWDVEKVHAVVARSTFPSQNVQNTPFSDDFWKLRCRKSARRCGAKHISKSKVERWCNPGWNLKSAGRPLILEWLNRPAGRLDRVAESAGRPAGSSGWIGRPAGWIEWLNRPAGQLGRVAESAGRPAGLCGWIGWACWPSCMAESAGRPLPPRGFGWLHRPRPFCVAESAGRPPLQPHTAAGRSLCVAEFAGRPLHVADSGGLPLCVAESAGRSLCVGESANPLAEK